ncbi:hypothetical protein O3P69_017823, partial [Scylla paramamosain]
IIKEFLRLEPQADEPDPRVAVLKGLEKYRLPIIAILKKKEKQFLCIWKPYLNSMATMKVN